METPLKALQGVSCAKLHDDQSCMITKRTSARHLLLRGGSSGSTRVESAVHAPGACETRNKWYLQSTVVPPAHQLLDRNGWFLLYCIQLTPLHIPVTVAISPPLLVCGCSGEPGQPANAKMAQMCKFMELPDKLLWTLTVGHRRPAPETTGKSQGRQGRGRHGVSSCCSRFLWLRQRPLGGQPPSSRLAPASGLPVSAPALPSLLTLRHQ